MPNIRSKKGFTLLEILVTVVIIAILAAIGGVTYGRFIERMRMGEAEKLLGFGVYAQDRQIIRRGRYTKHWHYLDATPRGAKPGSNYLSEDGTIYYTKGHTGADARNGFSVFFQQWEGQWYVTAQRSGNETYTYTMVRPFTEKKVYCLPAEGNISDQRICLDFMGLDEADELPADPRPEELQD